MKKISRSTVLKSILALFLLVFLYNVVKPLAPRGGIPAPQPVEDRAASGDNGEPPPPPVPMPAMKSAGVEKAPAREAALSADGLQVDVDSGDSYRKIIKSARISVKVKDVSRAYGDILSAVNGVSGYIVKSSVSQEGASSPESAEFTVEVPSERFDDAITALSGLGKVMSRSVSGQDVTGEYVDLQARLRNLTRVEEQFAELLTRAGNVNEILLVQDRLNEVQGEIEQAKGRLQLLSHETSMSEIDLSVAPLAPVAANPGFMRRLYMEFAGDTKDAAVAVVSAFVRTFATLAILLIWAVGYLFPLLLAGFAIWKLAAKYGKPLKAQIGG